MNKADLINKIHENAEGKLNKADAERAFDSLLNSLSKALASGESVNISGFGSLKPVRRAERKGRNPRTGEELTIAASSTVKFTPGKALKEAMN